MFYISGNNEFGSHIIKLTNENPKNQSIDEIIDEISKYNSKLQYRDISKEKIKKQIKLIAKDNKNIVLLTDNKIIINEALDNYSARKKYMLAYNKKCMLFDDKIKNNIAIKRFLSGDLNDAHCNVCYEEKDIAQSMRCCGFYICEHCLENLNICPICKNPLWEIEIN